MKLGKNAFTGLAPYQPPPADVPLTEPVLLIHGTFSNQKDPAGSPVPWWVPGSQFNGLLEAALTKRQSKARPVAMKDAFAWTGNNLESDRRAAGKELAARLRQLDADSSITRYHLIAHSHGGNVVARALHEFKPKNLGAVIFLGTPYLAFSDSARKPWKSEEVAFCVYALGLLASIGALIYLKGGFSSLPQIFAWTCVVIFSLCLYALFVTPKAAGAVKPKIPIDPDLRKKFDNINFGLPMRALTWYSYGSGKPYAFAFQADEAINLFRHVDQLWKEPRKTFNSFFSSPSEATSQVLAPTQIVKERTLLDDMKELPNIRLFQYLLNVNSPAQFNPAEPAEGFVLSTGIRAALMAFPPFQFFGLVVTGLISIPIAAPYLAVALAHSFARTIVKARDGIINHLILSKGPAISAGYLRNRVFGIDIGKCTGFENLPPFVFEHQPISEALETRIKLLSQKTGGWAGTAFSSVLADAGTLEIRSRFKEIFHNPDLAHCQYYQEPELVEAMANLIAQNARPAVNPLFSGLANLGKLS